MRKVSAVSRRKKDFNIPAGAAPFRVCDRCTRDTDSGARIGLFTGCGACGPTWLCTGCVQAHRDQITIYGGAR
jgi:hypothetical protein